MSKKFTLEELQTRLQTTLKETYTLIFSVMKGASVVNAFVVLPSFFSGKEPFSWLLIFLWISSFIAMILTFQGAIVGLIGSNFLLDWRDGVFPFLLSACEFSLFSMLQNQVSSVYWFFIFAVYIFLAGFIAYNAANRMENHHYNVLLEEFAAYWKRSTYTDSILAWSLAFISLVWATVGVYFSALSFYKPGSFILQSIFIIALLKGIQSQQRKLYKAYDTSGFISRILGPLE